MGNPYSLPPKLELVLRAVDAAEPVRLSVVMTVTELSQYHVMQTVEHLARLKLIRAVPPGARYELTAEGAARLAVLRAIAGDKSNRPTGGQP
jgi:hypothetical protein